MAASATPDSVERAPAPVAWQPLTFGGVAAFARAGLGRLLIVQVLVAGGVALSVVWFLAAAWFPTLTEAIEQLPATGDIRRGRLEWPDASPVRLAQGKFLSVVVDLERAAPLDQTADVQLEFGRNNVRVHSLLGYWPIAYPRGWIIALNRPTLEPWWGAWQPAVLAAVAVGVVIGLLFSWALLAVPYSLPIRVLVLFFDRAATGSARWRVAGMAQMPGALWMAAALFLYAHHQIGTVQLFAAWLAHWVIGWIYLVGAAVRLPKLASLSPAPGNPFSQRVGPRPSVEQQSPPPGIPPVSPKNKDVPP
jgi:hypothetical protein